MAACINITSPRSILYSKGRSYIFVTFVLRYCIKLEHLAKPGPLSVKAIMAKESNATRHPIVF